MNSSSVLLVALLAGLHGFACSAATGSVDSDAQRKKPLQRCDQLKGQPELDCLNKAREGIVEARRKRESAAEDKSKAGDTSAKPAAAPPAAK